ARATDEFCSEIQELFLASLAQPAAVDDGDSFGAACFTAQRLWASVESRCCNVDRLSATARILGLTSRALAEQKAFLATGSAPAIRAKPAHDRALLTALVLATDAIDGQAPVPGELQDRVARVVENARALVKAQREHDNSDAVDQARSCYEKLVALMGTPNGDGDLPWRRGMASAATWSELQAQADDELFAIDGHLRDDHNFYGAAVPEALSAVYKCTSDAAAARQVEGALLRNLEGEETMRSAVRIRRAVNAEFKRLAAAQLDREAARATIGSVAEHARGHGELPR
ncbi:unnamed protein product, partial [Prorocentrum cordatum]